MAAWEFQDATGVTLRGYVEKVIDRGGSDITYRMRGVPDGRLVMLSGSRLKAATVLNRHEPHRFIRRPDQSLENINVCGICFGPSGSSHHLVGEK